MKNILIVATSPQRFLGQLHLANEIYNKSNENIKINFFFDKEVYTRYSVYIDNFTFNIINKLPKIVKRKSYRYNLKEVVKKSLGLKQISILRKYLNILKNTIFFTNRLCRQEKKYLLDLENKYIILSKLVTDNKIDILLLNGDRHLGYEPIFLKISQEYHIPSILPYLVDFADKDRIFTDDVVTKKIKNNIFISEYIIKSQYNLNYRIEENSYYYSHPIGNALNKFGVLTSNPYVMGCGKSDILCLNNNYYKDLYIQNGVKIDKIRVLGDISYDALYRRFVNKDNIKKEIILKYSLNSKKQIIIVGLPQLGEHKFLPWDRHWEEINFLMSSLDNLEQNILISLHPKMDKKQYEFLELKYGCKILEENLVNILPIADVYVAFYSSTVVWSILCGIKTIVVDFYELNWTMYDFLTSIEKVCNKSDLMTVLNLALNKEIDFTQDWKNLSKDDVFDGKTIQRYINLIESVVKA
jgi:hypothetical protein